MTTRDELASFIVGYLTPNHDPDQADAVAAGILARWRLVPVEEAASAGEMYAAAWAARLAQQYAAQHRAADEPTRTDQAAGHYDDAGLLVHAMVDHAGGEVKIPMSRFVLAEGALTITRNAADDSITLRTDQHEPHED
jgi:hypothetical protein